MSGYVYVNLHFDTGYMRSYALPMERGATHVLYVTTAIPEETPSRMLRAASDEAVRNLAAEIASDDWRTP